MTVEDTDYYEIARLEKDGGFVFVVFLNGRPLPIVYWDETQTSVAIEFLTGLRERKTFGKRLIATSAQGLPPGYLLFELYDGEDFLGFVVWGPTGILPGVHPSPSLAVEAAVADYDDRRAPEAGYQN
ncbi:MAG: hypothetical protein DI528_18585 [Shinella sp.]|nr:MAG: hypothetical protein DI528_18585 [Shinella sp.]